MYIHTHCSATHLALIVLVTATAFPSASRRVNIFTTATHLALIVLVTATAFPSASTTGEYIHHCHPPGVDHCGDCHAIHNRQVNIFNTLPLIILVTATAFPSASTTGEYIHRSATHLALIMLVTATAFPSASTTDR